jgi:PBP1b-binding outer membrane lipoprotein LpoB
MKKIAILLSVLASTFVLASCASKTQPAPAADTTVHAANHHDFKGEGK